MGTAAGPLLHPSSLRVVCLLAVLAVLARLLAPVLRRFAGSRGQGCG